MKILPPEWEVEKKYSLRIEQYLKLLDEKNIRLLVYMLSSLSCLLFFVSDFNRKQNITLWALYRFGIAIGLPVIGIACSKILKTPYLRFLLIAYLLCLFITFSMDLLYPVRGQFMVWIPTIIFLFCGRFLLTNIIALALFVFFTKPLWINVIYISELKTDLILAIGMISISSMVWRIIVNNKVMQLESEDLQKENIEQKKIFYEELKKFVPPVLINRVESGVREGLTIYQSLDEALLRKYKFVSVLFSDLRNYSLRSDDQSFIETELLPSANKILELCEKNEGIGRHIGDAIMVYYDTDAVDNNVKLSLASAINGTLLEWDRVHLLSRDVPERFFTLSCGKAYTGNMSLENHKEATIIGKPINLAARIDDLTKNQEIKNIVESSPSILISNEFASMLNEIENFNLKQIDLQALGINLKSFPEEKYIYIFDINKNKKKIESYI